MQHNHRKPSIPLPPALPRFSLPHDGRDALEGEPVDPLDVAATSQRPTVRPGRSRSVPVIRKRMSADATEEVQVEDILLEVYAEDPPPPTRRSAALDLHAGSLHARDSIAMAIASVVPPPPAQSAPVDALLRASDPAFAPYAPFARPSASMPANAYGAAADHETPSVGPMTMATEPPPAARPVLVAARASRARPRAAALAIWGSMIVVLGIAVGGGTVLAVRNGAYARLRDGAKTAALSVTARSATKHDAPAPALPALAAAAPSAPALVPAPAPAPAPALATVSVDSLPRPAVAADASLVTLPAYADGHRVFLDGRVLPVVAGTPTKIKCGRHMLKIGSARKPRVVDFACGREVIVQ